MKELRLPWNRREGLLYGGIIALITAMIMATFNIAQKYGKLDAEVLIISLKSLPIIWAVVMLLMLLIVGKVSNICVEKFTEPGDGFNTRIVFKIIFCVTMMSASMSFLGPLVGEIMSGEITWDCARNWIKVWPVNFFAAFWVELLVAQPFARYIMKNLHIRTIDAEYSVQ